MKLSLDALKERAEATASTELLATISGGVENACHTKTHIMPNTGSSLADAIIIFFTW
jgi:hypothetical protein